MKNKDGSDYLCIDCRRLNRYMDKEIFPTPNIEERFQGLMNFTNLIACNLNSGYYQILIEESSHKFIALMTPDGSTSLNGCRLCLKMPFQP